MRNYSRSVFKQAAAIAVVGLCAWLPAASIAQDVDCAPPTYLERLLVRYSEAACRTADAGLAGRILQVTRDFYGPLLDGKSWSPLLGEQLSVFRSQLPTPSAPGSGVHIDAVKAKLTQAILEAEQLTGPEGLRNKDGLALDTWNHIESADSPGPMYLQQRGCEAEVEGAPEGCAVVYAHAVQITDTIYLTRFTLDVLHQWDREAFRSQAKLRGDRWQAYLYDTQFQYWWELAANRYLDEKCPGGLNAVVTPVLGKKCAAIPRDNVGNPIGWRDPPEYRAVFLHPDIGVQYNRNEIKGDRLKPSLVFQWIGYQWWDWQGSKVSKLKGISLVTTVSDNANARLIGHGIQLQLGQYAFAVTSHGGKPALTFSIDLLSRLNRLDEDFGSKLKALCC